GRLPEEGEVGPFRQFIAQSFALGLDHSLDKTREFMKTFPDAPPDVVIQHWASVRKASRKIGQINSARPPAELLAEMIEKHMENVAVAALASFMRRGNFQPRKFEPGTEDPFTYLFHALLGRQPSADEVRILGQLGAIQVHHGSAGSNMVARYFATLHTRSVSDL